MANDRYLIDALELENAALRARVAELVRLLSAAQDACDKAEAERRLAEQNLLQCLPAVAEPIKFGAGSTAASRSASNNGDRVS